MLGILLPTLVVGAVAVACAFAWSTQPRLGRNEALRVTLIVSTVATVALALVAGVEIVAHFMTFGLPDAF